MACLLARFSVPPLRSSSTGCVGRGAGDGDAIGIWVTAMGLSVAVGSAGVEGVGAEASTVEVAGAEKVGKLVAVVIGVVLLNWPSCVQDRTKSSAKAAISADSVAFKRGLNFMLVTRLKRTT